MVAGGSCPRWVEMAPSALAVCGPNMVVRDRSQNAGTNMEHLWGRVVDVCTANIRSNDTYIVCAFMYVC